MLERRSDGAMLVRSPHALAPYGQKLTARLEHWARHAPDRVFLAQREPSGAWRTLTYAQTYAAVRAIAAALIERDLSPDRPIAILSGNDIEHALLGLAAMHVGIPYAPISVPYSLQSQDFGKLKAIIGILTPGLVFAANGTAFARAIGAVVPGDVEVAVTANPLGERPTTHVCGAHGHGGDAGGRGGACARRRRHGGENPLHFRDRPACPRASSTPSACCAPTSR